MELTDRRRPIRAYGAARTAIKSGGSFFSKRVLVVIILFVLLAPLCGAQEASSGSAPSASSGSTSASGAAENIEPFSSEPFPVTKTDNIYHLVYFNDGWIFITALFHAKDNLFNRWGVYVVVAEPDGTSHWYKHEIEKEDVEFREDYLYISDGTNTIEGGGGVYSVRYYFDDFSCNLFFTNVIPSWQKDDGIHYLSKEKNHFEQRVLTSPWSRVGGHITIDGKRIEVTGQGYGEKSLSVVPFHKTGPLQYSMRLYSPNSVPWEKRWHISILDITADESYGSDRYSRLLCFHAEELLFFTEDYTMRMRDFDSVEGIPYEYPRVMELNAISTEYSIRGTFTAEKMFSYTDVMTEVPPIVRGLLLLFIDRPVYFRSMGRFQGTITMPNGETQSLNLYGPTEYVIVR